EFAIGRQKSHADYAWVAERLSNLKITQPDGSVAFNSFGEGFFFDDLITLLETHHVFDSDIPDVECRQIVRQAVNEAAREGEITERKLKGNILKHANIFKNKPLSNYVV